MRRIIILSCTGEGEKLNRKAAEYLRERGDVVLSFFHSDGGFTCGQAGEAGITLNKLLAREWNRTSAFLFIGAMGIAIRHVAPFLAGKAQDAAVLVIDEKGRFVIPALSGHMGGGVLLAKELEKGLGAQAVITTATDVEDVFAVDVFAERNHMRIMDLRGVKAVSAALLREETVDVYTGLTIAGGLPKGLAVHAAKEENVTENIVFCVRENGKQCELHPKRWIFGIGCKKGKTADELEEFAESVCVSYGIDRREIAAVASIDAKREEAGIWELSKRLGAAFETFSAEELQAVKEPVHSSAFVEKTVGVDNVCERSAFCLAKRWSAQGAVGGEGDGGELIVEKMTKNGMTIAVVRFWPRIAWE